MIQDPFKVLGVSPDVSDAELKKAYRDLSKKWHPDQNPDNTEYAEERFKEVQEAYRQIVDARAKGTDPYGTSYGSYGQAQQGGYGSGAGYDGYRRGYAEYGYGSSFEDFFSQWQQASYEARQKQEAARTEAEKKAGECIYRGDYSAAMDVLAGVKFDERGAYWNYLAAQASRGIGNNIAAQQFARKACDLDPTSQVYASYLRQLQGRASSYRQRGQNYGFTFNEEAASGLCELCCGCLLCNACGVPCCFV